DTELVLGRDDALEGAIVTISRGRTAGEFVRERGSDLRRGDRVVGAATRLAPRHLAALAASGVAEVEVRRRLRVGVIATRGEPVGASVGTVAMQPGGPQGTAVVDGVPIVCFPGNPVSTQVSFAVFLAPLLRRLAGLAPDARETRTVSAAIESVDGKRQFLRGI